MVRCVLWKASLVSFPQQTFQPDRAKWGEFFGIIVCVLIKILKQLVIFSHFVTMARYCRCVKERENLAVQKSSRTSLIKFRKEFNFTYQAHIFYYSVKKKHAFQNFVFICNKKDSPAEAIRGKQFENLDTGRTCCLSGLFYYGESGLFPVFF